MGIFSRKPRTPVTPASVATPTDVNASVTDTTTLKEQVLRDLDKLAVTVRLSGRDLPTVVYSKIRSIDDRLRPLMDYIEKNKNSPEQEYLLTHMVHTYIPDSISAFLSIHPNDRKEGSEAVQSVVEQFDLMEQKVSELDQMVRSGAVDALMTQGFFLESRFDYS